MFKKLLPQLPFVKLITTTTGDEFRYYDEREVGADQTLPIEMLCLFDQAFIQNYNIYQIFTTPIHNTILSKKDLEFFKQRINFDEYSWFPGKNLYDTFNLDQQTLQLLNNCSDDLGLIFKWGFVDQFTSNPDNNIGAYIAFPELKNNLLCWEFLLLTKKNFDITLFLKTNFKTLKIISIIQHNEFTLNYEFFAKKFDFANYFFKNCYIDGEKIQNSSYTTDVSRFEKKEILEKLKLELNKQDQIVSDLFDAYIKLDKNSLKYSLGFKKYLFEQEKKEPIWKQIYKIQDEIKFKKTEHTDFDIFGKLISQTISTQFMVFDENLLSDVTFVTNFNQIMNGVQITPNNGEILIEEFLYYYNLLDMIIYDPYSLNILFYQVYFNKLNQIKKNR